MAITWVRQRDSAAKLNSDSNSFTEEYLVKSDSFTDKEEDIAVANDGSTAIPALGTSHRSATAVVSDVTAKRYSGAQHMWVVTVEYTRNDDGPQPGDDNTEDPNRLDREIRFDTQNITTVIYEDGSNPPNAFRNSAGDPYTEGVEQDDALVLMTISGTVDFDKIDGGVVRAWKNSVHGFVFPPQIGLSNPITRLDQLAAGPPLFFGFKGFEPRLVNFGAGTDLIAGDTYWRVNLQFLMGRWVVILQDLGYYTATVNISEGVIASVAERQRILDDNNVPTDRPVPLDGKGAVSDGPIFWNMWTGQYSYVNHNALLQVLGLPTDINSYRVTF